MPRTHRASNSRPKSLPSRKKAEQRARVKEPAVNSAVEYLEELEAGGCKIDYAHAAKKFDAPYDTVRRRFLGQHKAPHDAHEAQKIMTSAQEEVFLEWMVFHAQEGRPWSQSTIQRQAESFTGRKPHINWVKGFRRRHRAQLKFCGTSGLDPKRAACFNPGTVKKHFDELGAAIDERKYKIHNRYNMDEKGCQIGGGRKRTGRKYFFPRSERANYKKRNANLELVTVIECCSADGEMLQPGFIFSGAGYEYEWFQDHPGISVGLTSNGWTDETQCEKWFEESFIPQARERAGDPEERVLLIFDGHGSHVTPKMMELAMANKIDFHLLPPHTTHKTQPLDVAVFGPMQLRWTERMEEIVEETGEGLPRYDFISEYMSLRSSAVTTQIVKAAWRKTGLEPFNPNVFTDADFAPSRMTSTKRSHSSSSSDEADVTVHELGPKVPQFTPTPIDKRSSLQNQISILQRDLQACNELYLAEFARRQKSETNCHLARREIQSLKGRINAKQRQQGRKSNRFQVDSNFLMSDAGLAQFNEANRRKADKERVEQERRDQRYEGGEEGDEEWSREAGDFGFFLMLSGNTSVRFTWSGCKRKADYQDIAYLLGLPVDATIAALKDSILQKVKDSPRFREDPRFSALY
ncbi:hypothetical protein PLICRDRAFT_119302, partial [Plicaturopsis crispa FD-325 SS-3]